MWELWEYMWEYISITGIVNHWKTDWGQVDWKNPGQVWSNKMSASIQNEFPSV